MEDIMIIILEVIVFAYIVYAACNGILKKTGWTDPEDRKKIMTAATISAICKTDKNKK